MRRILLLVLLTFIVSATFSQDLVITDKSVPSQLTRYKTPSISVTVKNQGILGIEAYTSVQAYFSLDGQLDNKDIFVGEVNLSPLSPNSSESIGLYSQVANVPAGDYLLLIKADYHSQVIETNETNNMVIVPVKILPSDLDFMISGLDITSPSVAKGDVLYVDYGIQNIGSTSTDGGVGVSFFLSDDEVFDASDTYLDNSFSYLTDDSGAGSASLVIPNVAPGSYQVIAVADGPFAFGASTYYEEADEANNMGTITIEIVASDVDLEPFDILNASIVQDPYEGMYYLNSSLKIRNNGTTGAAGVELEFFLSADDQLSEDDWYLGWHTPTFEKLAGGAEENIEFSQMVGFVPAGTYYFIAVINPSDNIEETIYSNNTTSFYPMVVTEAELIYVEMTNAVIATPVFTSDTDLHLSLTFGNPTSQEYQHLQWLSLELKNSVGESLPVDWDYLNLTVPGNGQLETILPVEIEVLLAVGSYSLNVRSERSELTIPFTVSQSHQLSGTVKGEDGTTISEGNFYLYRKLASGKLAFVKNYPVTGSNTFVAELNESEHTFYFVPDYDAYPGYVPTIYDKSVVITDAQFIATTQNITLEFEVLKINPLAFGEMNISGSIGDSGNSGGRGNARVEEVPVILLSENGDVVGLTHTDEEGFFEFPNVPKGIYQVVISMGLSDVTGVEPVQVDVTEYDAKVVFELDGESISAVSKSLPTLSITTFDEKTYGDPNFAPEVSSNTDQTMLLESSNISVAVIEDGEIKIIGAGTTVISAQLQETDEFFAVVAQQELIISKADQQVTFETPPTVTVGDAPFILEATSDFGLPVMFSSSNPAVASIDGNEVTIHEAGIAQITATQNGNDNINPANPVIRALQVNAITGIEMKIATKVFPNPTSGKMYVEGITPLTMVEVINSLGRTLKITNSSQVDLKDLPSGFYFLRIHSKTGKSTVRVVRE